MISTKTNLIKINLKKTHLTKKTRKSHFNALVENTMDLPQPHIDTLPQSMKMIRRIIK